MDYLKNFCSGRIGRLSYLAGGLIAWVGTKFVDKIEEILGRSYLSEFILIVLSLVVIYFSISIIIRRLHDLGKSGWFILLSLVPLVNMILGLALLLAPGDSKANSYGKPPRPHKQFLQELFKLP